MNSNGSHHAVGKRPIFNNFYFQVYLLISFNFKKYMISSAQSLKIILNNWRCLLLNLCRTRETNRKRNLPVKEIINLYQRFQSPLTTTESA